MNGKESVTLTVKGVCCRTRRFAPARLPARGEPRVTGGSRFKSHRHTERRIHEVARIQRGGRKPRGGARLTSRFTVLRSSSSACFKDPDRIVCESACKHIKEEASIYLAQGILGHMESHCPVVRRFCHLFGICPDPRGAWGERCVALGRRCGHWRPFPLVSASPTCSPSLPLVEAEPPVSVDRITSATRREWQERHAGPITQNSPGDTYSPV